MAARSLGTLTLDLVAKIGGFTQGLDQAERTAKKRSRSIAKEFGAMKVAFVAATAAAIAATGGLIKSALGEQEKLQRNMLRTEAIISATGKTAGFSAEQLHQQARELALATLQSTEGVMQAQQILLTFRSVAGDTFTRTTELAADLATVTGTSLTGAMTQLGKALEDPIRGIGALRKSGVSFTADQQKIIKSLVDTGRQAEAQKLILDELARQYGGVSRKEAEGLAGAQDTLGQRIQEAKLAFAEQLQLSDRVASWYNTMADLVLSVGQNIDKLVAGLEIAAVMIGTRYVAALGLAIAKKVILISSTVAATGALTAMRTVLLTLAGPAGWIALAAGAAYGLSQAFDDSEEKAQKMAKAVKGLTGELVGLTRTQLALKKIELSEQLAQQAVEIQKIGDRLAVARDKMRQSMAMRGEGLMPDVKDIRINIKATTDTQTLRQEFNTANETLKATGGAIQEVEKSLLRLKGVQQEDTIIPIAVDDKTQKKINSLFDKYKGLIKDLNSAEAEYQKTIEDLNKLRLAGKITQDEYNGAVQQATEIFEEAGGVYGKFRDLVLNVNEAEEQYRDTLRGLSELLEKGRITQDQYNDSVGKATQLFEDAGGVYGEYRDLIVNVNVAEKQYQESIRGLSDLLKKGTITQDQYNEAVMRAARAYEDAGGPLGEYAHLIAGIAESEKAYRTTIIDLNDIRIAGKITQDQYNEAVGKASQIFEDAGGVYGEYAALITGVDAAEKEYLKTKRDLKELLDRGRLSQDQYNESVKRAKVAYEDATTGIESFGELAREGAKRAQGHLADFLFDPFDKGLDGMVAGFADAMQRVAAEAAAASIMESLTEGMEDFDLSNLFSWLGSGKSSKGSDSPAETVLALGGADEAAASITAAMTESGSTVANDIAGSFAQDGGSFLSSMSSIFSQEGGGFLSSLGSIFSGLFSGFGDAASGAGDWIASAFGSFFGGGRASGGPVMAGSFYEVGERNQPELLRVNNKQYLIPGNSGSVEPMAGGRRGGGNTYQTWNITTPNPDGFRMTERQQRRQARRFVS
jgi:hypothetical protein